MRGLYGVRDGYAATSLRRFFVVFGVITVEIEYVWTRSGKSQRYRLEERCSHMSKHIEANAASTH